MASSPRQVAEDLQKWAKSMGYVPGGKFMSTQEFPSTDAFQKICKGKTVEMWQNIMRQVRPKDEALHIQKNLLLQRLQSKKPLEQDPVPGHLCRQLILAKKLAGKKKERKELLEAIELKEASIRAKEKALRKSGHKVLEVENQIDELKKKQLLFKIKTEECHSKIDYFKQISNVAVGLCPPAPNAMPASAKTSDLPDAALRKCLDTLRDFHSRTETVDLSSSYHDEHNEYQLKHLWEQVRSNLTGWGAQHLREAIDSRLMVQTVEEISPFIRDETKAVRPAHDQTLHMCSLSAKLMVSTLEAVSLETKAQIKQAEVNELKQELILKLQGVKFNSSQQEKSFSNTADIVGAWVNLQAQKAELVGKLQGIKSELSALKESTSNLPALSLNLKLVKEDLARLDFQVEHDKKKLEENLACLKQIPERLESARAKALAQSGKFNDQLPLFFQLSKSKRDCSDSDSSTPSRATRFTSTMIDNETPDPNLTFNSTFGSIAEKFVGPSNLSDIMAQLKESVSIEAKLFIKLHLETVPFVYVNGKREALCDLLVNAPLLKSHSSNISHRNFMQIVKGTPFMSAPQILLKHLHTLTHVKALQRYKVLNPQPCPAQIEASTYFDALKRLSSKQEADLFEKVEVATALADKVDSLLAISKGNLTFWLDQPIQEALPADLVVKGRTFTEWCKEYDGIL